MQPVSGTFIRYRNQGAFVYMTHNPANLVAVRSLVGSDYDTVVGIGVPDEKNVIQFYTSEDQIPPQKVVVNEATETLQEPQDVDQEEPVDTKNTGDSAHVSKPKKFR